MVLEIPIGALVDHVRSKRLLAQSPWLVALMLLYLYNFRVLDLDRIPYMSSVIKNVYAFVNLAMTGFVMATVAVRFRISRRLVGRGGVLDRWIGTDPIAGFPVVEILDWLRAGAGPHGSIDGYRRLAFSASIRSWPYLRRSSCC